MANGDVGRRDGGYAWVIVFAFFALQALADGIRFSFGLLFVEWLNDFGTGKGETAWVGSIMIASYNLCGMYNDKRLLRGQFNPFNTTYLFRDNLCNSADPDEPAGNQPVSSGSPLFANSFTNLKILPFLKNGIA